MKFNQKNAKKTNPKRTQNEKKRANFSPKTPPKKPIQSQTKPQTAKKCTCKPQINPNLDLSLTLACIFGLGCLYYRPVGRYAGQKACRMIVNVY
jgi:hypothetical protein